MRNINLIPPDVLEGWRIASRIRFWIVVNVAVLVLLGAVFGISAWGAKKEKDRVWKLDHRLSELQHLTAELEGLRAERDRLGKEERALASLLDRPPDFRLVGTLAEAVVDHGWLTQVELVRPVAEAKEKTGRGNLTLRGHAGSYAHLARLMRQVGSLEYIAEVGLKSSQRVQSEGLDVIQFELECPLASGT